MYQETNKEKVKICIYVLGDSAEPLHVVRRIGVRM